MILNPGPARSRSGSAGHRSAPRAFATLLMGLSLGLLLSHAQPALAAPLSVDALVVEGGDQTEVVLTLNQPAAGGAISTFTTSGPDRLVIDLADASAAPGLASAVGATGLVKAARVESFDDGQGQITRITLTLSGPVEHRVEASGNMVHIKLSPRAREEDPLAEALGSGGPVATPTATPATSLRLPSGPCLSGSGCEEGELPAGPGIRSLDFKNVDSASRILVGTRAGATFTHSQPRKDLIVVDFPGVFLPESLGRVIDTTEFVSPVKMVRAYRTSSGARVAISLRADTTYTARMGDDGTLVVDVAIPAGMQREMETAVQESGSVAPQNPEGGLSNAYQSELMISSSGRTSDPRSSFGSGAGASDPSALISMGSGMGFDGGNANTSYSGRRISLDLVNADIHSVFRLISHVSNLNIVAGDDVKGSITVRLQDVPWDQALEAILQARGLGYQRFGNIIRVAPIETIKSEKQAALEAQTAEDLLVKLDVLVLPLNFASAEAVEKQVTSVLTSRGTVEVDSRANQLIIQDTAESLAKVRELVRHLDKQTPQVLIEARVVEANTSYTRALGIQWGGEVDASSATGYSTGLFFPNNVGVSGGLSQAGAEQFYTAGADSLLVDLGASGSTSAIAMTLGSIPGLMDLDVRLSALESDGYGRVISSPRVITLDNETAKIRQGAKIPFLSTSAGGTNVQFIQAALEMTVTPHITDDGKVFLKVTIENNRADFSKEVQGQPTIQIKEVETELLVGDGDTTVIGGVFSTEESESQGRTPGLSKIPLLGALFKNSLKATTRSELLVFITPHVINVPTAASSD